jgi:hypothetical protein
VLKVSNFACELALSLVDMFPYISYSALRESEGKLKELLKAFEHIQGEQRVMSELTASKQYFKVSIDRLECVTSMNACRSWMWTFERSFANLLKCFGLSTTHPCHMHTMLAFATRLHDVNTCRRALLSLRQSYANPIPTTRPWRH